MKLTEEKPKFQQSNLDEEGTQNFGIGDASVVIEILRNRLYENKIQTLVQEYMSNARDAHREIGQTAKIQVTFPTRQEPHFVVRDFGPGITPDRMSNVFVLYGASTKRTTNNQTGGFGIGAKSAWSYTDSFEVTTYVDGVMRLYVAEIGSHKNGALNKIMECETTEPNGTKISIMIKPYDSSDFGRAIVRGSMFWTEEEYPEFLNSSDWDNNLKNSRKVGLSRFMDTNMSGQSPHQWAGGNSNTLVVDGIPYPMPNVHIPELEKLRNEANASHLTVFIPNGLVQVSASREKIDDSDTSKKALKQIFVAALDEFYKAKQKWEDTIVDSQTLIDSRNTMCGFQLTSDKHIDYVHISKGQIRLQMTAEVEGPEIEYEILGGGKQTKKVKLKQRLFNVNGVDSEESSKDHFDINGKDKFYLVKSGNVRILDIRNWLDSEASEDVVSGWRINLITVLGQQQEVSVDDKGRLEYEYKRNADLVAEIIPALERMGFQNIEKYVQKPKEEKKADKPRITGHIYRVDAYDETFIPLANLEDEKQEKPWVYFVGKKNDWHYNQSAEIMRTLKKSGDIQYAFRVTDSRKKKLEEDKRFVEYSEFIKKYKPSNETVLGFIVNGYVNDGADSRMKSYAVKHIAKRVKDKSHPLAKACTILNNSPALSSNNWTLRELVLNTSAYKEAIEGIKLINKYINDYVPMCNTSDSSIDDKHMEEYLAWGLAKAAADGAVLTLPKVLT